MFTNKQVCVFCNLMMHTDAQTYIKIIGRKKDIDTTKLANDFIFQHVMDSKDYEPVLQAVIGWWDIYTDKQKILSSL